MAHFFSDFSWYFTCFAVFFYAFSRYIYALKIKEYLPKCPPPILPKCPTKKSRTIWGILLIRVYNGDFFLKTHLKFDFFAPIVPSPMGFFSSKINFTLVYRTFFSPKSKKFLTKTPNHHPHFLHFFNFLPPFVT